uniref:Si:dkey-38p12.3 n=1 Tax=Cyprinus carpio TaxID=7962 RepID=A0A8C1YJ04_CYPCA
MLLTHLKVHSKPYHNPYPLLAPDGKEGSKLREEQDSSPLPEPQCEKNCGCICHLQKPGMKLVWVPISEQDDDEGKDDEIEYSDTEDQNKSGEGENEDNSNKESDSLSESIAEDENKKEELQVKKGKFQETRNLIEQGLSLMPYFLTLAELYQFYTETYIHKEIRRTVCRNISKTSMDFQMDPHNTSSPEKGEKHRSSSVPNLKQANLWREQQTVRDSGVLQTLSSEECKYQESMFEVITSEMSYLRSLRVITDHFMESSELNDTLINMDKKTLFSNILRIREVSERFLKDLEERVDESVIISDICDIIHYHAQHHFPAYIDYVRNQIYQEKTYSNLMQTNTQFATVITRLQESPICQRLPFMSFMLLPFQRITRIKMLIENILKRTAVGTDKEQTASKALDSVSKIIEECNTQVGKMKQMEELIQINGMLEFDKLKAVPIVSQTRYLEKRGELQEVNRGGTFLNLRPKFSPVYLFLFNDLLIIASKKSSERYVVLDHAHRSLVQVQPFREDTAVLNIEHSFCLTLLENHQGRQMERVLKAPTQCVHIIYFTQPRFFFSVIHIYKSFQCTLPFKHCFFSFSIYIFFNILNMFTKAAII